MIDLSHLIHIRCQRSIVYKMIKRTNIDEFTRFFHPRLLVLILVRTIEFFHRFEKNIDTIHTCQLNFLNILYTNTRTHIVHYT